MEISQVVGLILSEPCAWPSALRGQISRVTSSILINQLSYEFYSRKLRGVEKGQVSDVFNAYEQWMQFSRTTSGFEVNPQRL